MACEWSFHHFERYNKLWTAYLARLALRLRWQRRNDGRSAPAGFPGGGHSGIAGAKMGVTLACCDWQAALGALRLDAPAPEFTPLATGLTDRIKEKFGMVSKPQDQRHRRPECPEFGELGETVPMLIAAISIR